VHLFGRAEDGVDGAGLDAFGAADADIFINHGNRFYFLRDTVLGVDRQGVATQEVGQRDNAGFTTGWALIDFSFAISDGLCVGTATWKAALPTLRLRQDGVDLIDQRITLDFETHRGIAERDAEGTGQTSQSENCA
jgi:hypothetical protein